MGLTELIQARAPDRYKQYYLRYAQLKDLVLELAGDASPPRSRLMSADLMDLGSRPTGRFQEMLQAELSKVNQFACVKHESVFLDLRRCCEDCKRIQPADLETMANRIDQLGEEICHLDTFVRLNYQAFQKLTQKFDSCLGVSGSAIFVAGLHNEPFCNVRFDDICILLGLAWARWRSSQMAEQSKDATWKPPESFIRNTAKYWVHPDKVVLLKSRIVKHLPYLIFGASEKEQERLLDPFALLDLEYEGFERQSVANAYSGNMEEAQILNSVYFDSPDAVSYRERIRREEGARLVRFRWYGENNWEPDKEIYVERKIHHEGFSSASSAKERCIVPQKDIFEFMKGRFPIEEYFARLKAEGANSDKALKNMKGICNEVNTMIQEKKLQPMIRTSYYRSAFQLSTSNEVRVSLDTQMTLLNEYREEGHPEEPWCLQGAEYLTKDKVYRFPFAILEIKLTGTPETPPWLRKTLADIEAIQVHKFSKFQHAMAFLHPKRVPILPHWHQDFQVWHERRLEEQRNVTQRRTVSQARSWLSSKDSHDDLAVPKMSTAAPAPGGDGHLLKDMQNLDPKAVFANERTLLHYVEKGLYSSVLGVLLLKQETASYRWLGGALVVASVAYFVWCLAVYQDRLARITGRSSVGKDRSMRLYLSQGPYVVGSLVALVLAIAFALQIVSGRRVNFKIR